MWRVSQAIGDLDYRGIERGVPAADSPQRPAHAFLHEIAVIIGRTLDQPQPLTKLLVAGGLVVACEARQQGERRALDEFLFARAPLCDFLPGVRSPVEEAEA